MRAHLLRVSLLLLLLALALRRGRRVDGRLSPGVLRHRSAERRGRAGRLRSERIGRGERIGSRLHAPRDRRRGARSGRRDLAREIGDRDACPRLVIALEPVRATDLGREVADRLGADVGVLGERLFEDVVERLRDWILRGRALLAHRLGILREDREEDRRAVVARERDGARDALVGDGGEREDVGARVERLEALSLLGRHVERRADGRAEHGQLLRVLVLVLDRSEVEDLDVVALTRPAEEQVVGLEVAVHELAAVRLVEADGGLREHAHEARGLHRLLALQDEAELLAVEELHHEQPDARRLVALEVHDLHDVVVRQLTRDLVLALEALERDLVLRYLVVEDLHGDARLRLLVDALVDASHAAVGDDAAELVAVAQARAEARILFGVRDGHHAGVLQRASVRRAEARVVRKRAHALGTALHGVRTRRALNRPS